MHGLLVWFELNLALLVLEVKFQAYMDPLLMSKFCSSPSLRRLVLDVDAFERLLGPCMNIMKRNIGDYETQLIKIFGSKNNITDIR